MLNDNKEMNLKKDYLSISKSTDILTNNNEFDIETSETLKETSLRHIYTSDVYSLIS